MKTIEQRVLDILYKKYSYTDHKVTPESKFVADLLFDSLDETEFVMDIEREFDIELDDHEALNCVTVADAVRLIEKEIA